MLHTSIIKILLNLSRRMKTILVMFVDYLVLVFSFWASLSVRLNSFYNPSLEANYLIIFGPVIAVLFFIYLASINLLFGILIIEACLL